MDQEYPYRSRPTTSYVNQELASALQDVVQVTRNGSSQPVSASNSRLGLASVPDAPRAPSPRMPGAFEPAMSVSPPKDPFRDDLEPTEAAGKVDPDRAKFKGPSTSSNNVKKPSSSRRDKDRTTSDKDANKKPSRHADVIDTWDPSGLGSALWHHSGPYDAAAPSRNLNQPTTKAPMRAFEREEAEKAAAAAAAAAAAIPKESPSRTGPTAISHAPPPPVPPKDIAGAPRRPSAAAARSMPRRTSGGLSGQYSTSYPTGGGYFPNQDIVPDDETPTSPRYQRRQKEEKQRALKAAWGIDEPEPFEDFGSSPRDESYIDRDHLGSPNEETGARGGFFGRSAKSPGVEEVTSPGPDDQTFGAKATRPGGGVKRTKSLMQKIKSMRGDRSDRSQSPSKYSPSTEYPPMPALSPGLSPSNHAVRPSMDDHRRPSLPARPERAAARLAPTSTSAPSTAPGSGPGSKSASANNSSHGHSASLPPEMTEEIVETVNGNGHGHSASAHLEPYSYSSGGMRRPSKNLPQPPIGPVMPDFDDLVRGRRGSANLLEEGAPVKRKTSVVKKLTGRVGK
ncbi:hypothetical protein CC85DRAFT_327175 [Cutaneotrichosporon oleaginosum]|uniref:Pal1-domain-containing protein n=1 Tax=Cutaneotrichosporon oleaginosum TaxID=879819 RepID=A0A0J0XRB5_9TREE|nr:uncharacterized protein CC85DRAFT_327175 [Cutaneotrichosporon oleaginosum]KLT43630.1 hypothetical protein CC85DRAFT_327175 [Cutaneotrichosporon oleaginosum]